MFLFFFFILIPALLICLMTGKWTAALILGIVLLCALALYIRRLYSIEKVRTMTGCEKLKLLDLVIEPSGYRYEPSQDIFTTTIDAWQRKFGYGQLYDVMAPHFQMYFDALPVYFDYDGRTWLIELWKGQYGINTGAEIGVYHADKIVPAEMLPFHIFDVVSDDELLCMSLELRQDKKTLVRLRQPHWWLTAFCMGHYAEPGSLLAKVSIHFPESDMMHAFVQSLTKKEHAPKNVYTVGKTAYFTFDSCPGCSASFFRRLFIRLGQWRNRILCKLFIFATSPFTSSMDRLLYLYYFAPFAFRRMFTIHSYKKISRFKRK